MCCSPVIFQKLQQQTEIKKKKKLFADLETHDVIVCLCQNMKQCAKNHAIL